MLDQIPADDYETAAAETDAWLGHDLERIEHDIDYLKCAACGRSFTGKRDMRKNPFVCPSDD